MKAKKPAVKSMTMGDFLGKKMPKMPSMAKPAKKAAAPKLPAMAKPKKPKY